MEHLKFINWFFRTDYLSSKDEDEEYMNKYLKFYGIKLSSESFIKVIKDIRNNSEFKGHCTKL